MIDTQIDCLSMGIVTPLKDYRFCWHLNKALQIELHKIDDLVLTIADKKKQSHFTRFKYEEPLTRSSFFVLENKHDAEYLLPEIKKADYIFMIKGNYYQAHEQEIKEKIKTIEDVQTILHMDIEKLKSKNNLMYYDDEKGRK